MDFTGCGNSLNVRHPQVLKLIMDSLRYWVTEMHVDGFRFDLASALARELYEVDSLAAPPSSTSFTRTRYSPPPSSLPNPGTWGKGATRWATFPLLWSEWNGKYRDSMRDFWRDHDCRLGEFAFRLTGSSDLYQGQTASGPTPASTSSPATMALPCGTWSATTKSTTKPTAKTTATAKSYNRSWNCGEEGETDDPDILALRLKQQRNFLTTLMLSQGVPMILGGDELGRTKTGQQQTPIVRTANCPGSTGTSPPRQPDPAGLYQTAHPLPPPASHLCPSPLGSRGGKSTALGSMTLAGTNPDGGEITDEQWHDGSAKALCVFMNGGRTHSP